MCCNGPLHVSHPDARGRESRPTVSKLTGTHQGTGWKVTARQDWHKAGWKCIYCCSLSVPVGSDMKRFHSSRSNAIEVPDKPPFLPGLLRPLQHKPTLWKIRQTHSAHMFCLSRVYHIDSNPSSASDSGADFAKGFAVRSRIPMLRNRKGMHLNWHLIFISSVWLISDYVGTFFCLWPEVSSNINDPEHSVGFKSVWLLPNWLC